jgi:hypothetical protein
VREPELSRAAHAWYLLCHGVAGGSAVGDAVVSEVVQA